MALNVTPLPAIGDVVAGRDVAGRELRISGHPESDRVVLSIWQSGHCLATVRLARADVPEVTRALVSGLVPVPEQRSGLSGQATVHELRTGHDETDDRPDGPLRQFTDRLDTAVTSLLSGRLGRRLRRFGDHDFGDHD
jgi:hypothetical protein